MIEEGGLGKIVRMSIFNAPCRTPLRAHATRSLIDARCFHLCGVGPGHSFLARFPMRTASKRLGSTLRLISVRHSCKSVHRSVRVKRRHTPAVNCRGERRSPLAKRRSALHYPQWVSTWIGTRSPVAPRLLWLRRGGDKASRSLEACALRRQCGR